MRWERNFEFLEFGTIIPKLILEGVTSEYSDMLQNVFHQKCPVVIDFLNTMKGSVFWNILKRKGFVFVHLIWDLTI